MSTSARQNKVRSAADAVRTQLWPMPTAAVIVSVAVGLSLPRFDRHVDGQLPLWITDVLFGGDPGAARTMLDAVASSLITVTSLTFSLTVVTLQLASSQFSPRLLRTFTRDVFVQGTLALFLSTFTYSLAVLRSVRSAGDGENAFVPRISVTIGFVLAVLSVVGLVLFLAHLTAQIRVETMLQNVHKEASATLRAVTSAARLGEIQIASPSRGVDEFPLLGPASGFVKRIDGNGLLRCAVDLDLVLVIDSAPGSPVVEGVPIGSFWARSDKDLSLSARDDAQRRAGAMITTDFERTAVEDVGYGLRQLSDVATKALSPGINDPTTAVHALGHISALLCDMATRELGPHHLSDENDIVRITLRGPTLADLVDGAITQPRRYGASDPQVVGRLFRLLAEVAWNAGPDAADVVLAQLERLRHTVSAQDFDATELGHFRELGQRVELALAGRWHA